MTSSRRDFFKKLTQTLAGAAVGGAAGSGCQRKSGDQDENPYAYDLSALKKIDPSLMRYKELSAISIETGEPHAICVDGNDHLYVAADRTVLLFESSGQPIRQFETGSPVKAIAADTDGTLFLGMIDHVEIWSAEGEQKAVWESLDRQAVITSVVISGESVYVADAGNKRVYQFNRMGQFLNNIEPLSPGFVVPSPYFDVAADHKGSAWIVNPGKHTILKVLPDGSAEKAWGTSSYRIEGFSGCCNPTHLTLLPNGDFVTSEKGLPRVKVYDPKGSLKAVVAGPEQFEERVTGLDLAADSKGHIFVLDPHLRQVRRFQVKKEGAA